MSSINKEISNHPKISVVTPVYKSKDSLAELLTRLITALSSITDDFEIIMVNDGCPQGSWETIDALAQGESRLKGINLSRNFGQHYAISAGLDYAHGDWVVVMDCDLQDQPEEIPKLYQKAQEGYDQVVGLRAKRNDSFFKKLFSAWFYRIFAYFADTKIDGRVGNFGVYSKQVIQSIRRFKERNRSFVLFAIWVGFKRAEIEIEHAWRPSGVSSYTFRTLLKLAMDSTIAHSDKMLRLTVKLGFLMSASSVLYVFWLILMKFIKPHVELGWTSVMVSIFFATGLIIASIGTVGLYVGKIFDETKNRPLYIVKSTTMKSKNDEA